MLASPKAHKRLQIFQELKNKKEDPTTLNIKPIDDLIDLTIPGSTPIFPSKYQIFKFQSDENESITTKKDTDLISNSIYVETIYFNNIAYFFNYFSRFGVINKFDEEKVRYERYDIITNLIK